MHTCRGAMRVSADRSRWPTRDEQRAVVAVIHKEPATVDEGCGNVRDGAPGCDKGFDARCLLLLLLLLTILWLPSSHANALAEVRDLTAGREREHEGARRQEVRHVLEQGRRVGGGRVRER